MHEPGTVLNFFVTSGLQDARELLEEWGQTLIDFGGWFLSFFAPTGVKGRNRINQRTLSVVKRTVAQGKLCTKNMNIANHL